MTTFGGNTIPPLFGGGGGGPLPLINLGNHSLRLGFPDLGATEEPQVTFYGAFIGYVELRISVGGAIGVPIVVEMDGTTVVNSPDSVYPLPILATPPGAEVVQNTQVLGLQVGYTDQWISDNLGRGGSNFVPANDYDWRWTLQSGQVAQQLSNASDNVWVQIGGTTTGFWRWAGIAPHNFVSEFLVEIRDPALTIVASGTFSIERFTV